MQSCCYHCIQRPVGISERMFRIAWICGCNMRKNKNYKLQALQICTVHVHSESRCHGNYCHSRELGSFSVKQSIWKQERNAQGLKFLSIFWVILRNNSNYFITKLFHYLSYTCNKLLLTISRIFSSDNLWWTIISLIISSAMSFHEKRIFVGKTKNLWCQKLAIEDRKKICYQKKSPLLTKRDFLSTKKTWASLK